MRRKNFYILFALAGLFAIALALFSQSSGPIFSASTMYTVRGNSLSGLIESGEEVEIYWGYYDRFQVERSDIVAYRYPGNSAPLIKVVVGMPSDDFSLIENKEEGSWLLIINGQKALNNSGSPYAFSRERAELLRQYEKDYQGRIPEGAFILLGTQPGGSLDSSQFGFASRKNFLGKVVR